jgi:hypothetical protein
VALIVAVMSMLLMSALGAALVLTTSSDVLIAANFRSAHEAVYAADAALERAMDDLATIPDWNAVLDGSSQSTFNDGAPGGIRTLADGSSLDLGQALNMMNCRKMTTCTPSNLTTDTALRPWGENNPVWRLFAYGPLSAMLPNHALDSPYYVVVMIADDPSENDGDPLHDGGIAMNPGSGVLALHAEALGPRGARQIVEMTVARAAPGQGGMRVLSWRLTR